MSGYEDLFNEAETELEQEEVPAEWGELRATAEGERLLGRYLGSDVLPPFNDGIYRFVTYPGEPEPFYLRSTARLARAIDEASPNVGDVVALVRGTDRDVGKQNPMQTWAVRVKPCEQPLPATTVADSDIPW